MLGRLEDFISNGLNISIVEGLEFTVGQASVRDYIVFLNTQKQLFDKGIGSDGVRLEQKGGAYAPLTIQIKQSMGLPVDRVTLFQTGNYYSTFTAQVKSGELIIDSEPQKPEQNLIRRYGEDVEGLTEENKALVAERVAPMVVEWLINELLK